jgi:hypothetical protein
MDGVPDEFVHGKSQNTKVIIPSQTKVNFKEQKPNASRPNRPHHFRLNVRSNSKSPQVEEN